MARVQLFSNMAGPSGSAYAGEVLDSSVGHISPTLAQKLLDNKEAASVAASVVSEDYHNGSAGAARKATAKRAAGAPN